MPPQLLNNIRIVLVEPAGPLNVGSVARVMKNMGLSNLVIVNPRCDPFEGEARQMAVHAIDVLESASVVPSLTDGLKGCRRAIATLGRSHTLVGTLEHPQQALPWLLGTGLEPSSGALIFGPEDRGLSNEELNQAHRFICIPSNPIYPSLNLAQAVAICCYELYQLTHLPSPVHPIVNTTSPLHHPSTPFPPDPAPLEQLEGFYQQLETVLLNIGYLYPHTATSRMQKFRRLFSRAMPSTEEVTMLRGILRQVEWATQHKQKS